MQQLPVIFKFPIDQYTLNGKGWSSRVDAANIKLGQL